MSLRFAISFLVCTLIAGGFPHRTVTILSFLTRVPDSVDDPYTQLEKTRRKPKRLPPDNTVMKNAQKAPTKLELSKKANLTPYIFQVQKLPVPLHHALQYKDQFHALQRIPGVFQRSYQSFHFFCPYHSAVHPQKSW